MKAFFAALAVSLIAQLAFGADLAKEDVTLVTADAVTVSAFFVPGKTDKSPAVVLVHMLGRSKEDWLPILERHLVPSTPYAYLAIDLRGHGKSTSKNGKEISYKDFSADDWRAAVADIEAAVKYLASRNDVDSGKVALIGASIGANLALNYAAQDPGIKALVLLSPGLDYRGVAAGPAMGSYGNRPVLVVSGQDDTLSYAAGRMLERSAKGKYAFWNFPGNLHGTRVFGIYDVDKPIADFLAESLK